MAHTKVPKRFTQLGTVLHRSLYRLSGGASRMFDMDVVLLTTKGRRSGKERTVPLFAVEHGDGWAVVASNSGHDQHPAWYLNLTAAGEGTVTLGSTKTRVRPRGADDAEREELWKQFVDRYSGYAEYQRVTDRAIPVVVLEPV